MNIFIKTAALSFLFFLSAARVSAFEIMNLWRHPEIADKNSVFFDVGLAPLVFENFEFDILPIDIRIDYLPPLPLPISIGAFFKTPNPNLKSFGLRAAYHFDLLDSSSDFYFAYSFDFGFLRNGLLLEYGDEPVEKYLYDFRVGARYFFGKFVGVVIESGFHFESVIILLSIKIN